MKKEKKAIVKNSQYYYSKGSDIRILRKIFNFSCAVMMVMGFTLPYTYVEHSDKEFLIKNQSGYIEYKQNEENQLREELLNGEISQDTYISCMETLNNETLEGYLKRTDNQYYLAQYKESLEEKNIKSALIIGSAISLTLIGGIVGIGSVCNNLRKAEKLKEEEDKKSQKPEIQL